MMRAEFALWLSLLIIVQCCPLSNSAGVVTWKNLIDHAEAGSSGRALLQSGTSCFADIPACTARRCTTRILDSKETYVCLRCLRSYVPALGNDGKSIVQCVCPQGTYEVVSGSSRSCQPCPQGSYCPGGSKNARKPTDNYGGVSKSCNPPNSSGLTTKSARATKVSDCVALGGYALPRTKEAPAVECMPSTYSPNLNSLKSCLPCQSGLQEPPDFKANGGIRSSKEAVCKLPPGRFWELNVVRDCPVGLYREGYVNTTEPAAIKCLSCPEGWTTQAAQSIARSNCSRLLPGRKLVSYQAGSDAVSQDLSLLAGEPTETCPLGYYFDGNTPGVYGCLRCPLGSTTKQNGSTSVDDCLVAPGYYIQSLDNAVTGQMVKCPNNISTKSDAPPSGYYRSGWVSPTQVLDSDGTKACTQCGEGIPSRLVEADERVDMVPPADPASDPTYGLVAATSASCYIQAGWGMTFDPLEFTKFRAIIPCPANTYGVAQEVFGLFMAPCKACTKNLYSLAGSKSIADCKNPGGFGYTSEGANQCPDGFWAAKDSMNPCEPCPEGRMTSYVPGNGSYQSSIDSCKVKPGMGVYSGAAATPWAPDDRTSAMSARPCPFDMYSLGDGDDVNATSNPICQPCLDNQATSKEGSSTCDVCKPGAGGSSGSCTTCPYNTYQPGWETSDGLTCMACPKNTWNHNVGETVRSYGITFFTGMTNPYMCVPRYSQAANPAGARLALPDSVFSNVDAATVTDCLAACPVDQCCVAEFEQYDGGAAQCKHALLPPAKPVAFVASAGSDEIARLYYKLPPSGMFAAASIKNSNSSSNGVNCSSADCNTTQPPTGMLAAASIMAGNSSNNSNSTISDGKVKAKTMASGIFAVCDMTAWLEDAAAGLVGTSPNPASVQSGRDAIEWSVWGLCSDEASCHQSCISDASCWGFIYVPGKGFALRTGEAGLGVRSFFVSSDPAAAQTKSQDGVSAASAAAYSPV